MSFEVNTVRQVVKRQRVLCLHSVYIVCTETVGSADPIQLSESLRFGLENINLQNNAKN
jgi:hypothetical protein